MQDKTVIVTQAATAVGSAQARWFAKYRSSLVLCGGHEPPGANIEQLALDVERLGAKAQIVGDGATNDGVRTAAAVVEAAQRRFDSVDALVINAVAQPEAELRHTDPEVLRRAVEAQVLAPVELAQAFCRSLEQQATSSPSSIVVVTGANGFFGVSGGSARAVVEGALAAWTRALAAELAPRGVRCNAVAALDPESDAERIAQVVGCLCLAQDISGHVVASSGSRLYTLRTLETVGTILQPSGPQPAGPRLAAAKGEAATRVSDKQVLRGLAAVVRESR